MAMAMAQARSRAPLPWVMGQEAHSGRPAGGELLQHSGFQCHSLPSTARLNKAAHAASPAVSIRNVLELTRIANHPF